MICTFQFQDASDRSHDSTIVKDEHHAEDTLTPDHEVNKVHNFSVIIKNMNLINK